MRGLSNDIVGKSLLAGPVRAHSARKLAGSIISEVAERFTSACRLCSGGRPMRRLPPAAGFLSISAFPQVNYLLMDSAP